MDSATFKRLLKIYKRTGDEGLRVVQGILQMLNDGGTVLLDEDVHIEIEDGKYMLRTSTDDIEMPFEEVIKTLESFVFVMTDVDKEPNIERSEKVV